MAGLNLPDDATDWSVVPGIGSDLLDDVIGWSGQCPGFVYDGIIMNILFASCERFFLFSDDNSTGTYEIEMSDAPNTSDAIFGLTAWAPYAMSSSEGFMLCPSGGLSGSCRA